MFKRRMNKVGNSLCVTVPADLVRQLGMALGDEVSLEPTPDGFIVRVTKEEA